MSNEPHTPTTVLPSSLAGSKRMLRLRAPVMKGVLGLASVTQSTMVTSMPCRVARRTLERTSGPFQSSLKFLLEKLGFGGKTKAPH